MRNVVQRDDGKPINVRRMVGQLFVCSLGCCCGRTDEGFPANPVDLYHAEWERRRLRTRVHLTIGGCLGPCALANVVMLLMDGRTWWFHSMNHDGLVIALYDYIEAMLAAGLPLDPPPALAPLHFTAGIWEERPDGLPLSDRHRAAAPPPPASPVTALAYAEAAACHLDGPPACEGEPERVVANMDGAAALPRKNGELVFEAPWEGRAFGMVVALHERSSFEWSEFQRRLIDEVAAAEARGEPSTYYERWLASFEALLVEKGIVSPDELDNRTDEFEWGDRDDVY
ncbi:MAG: nitrile hydratase accessory protein [Dehalococcoidia bacterium]